MTTKEALKIAEENLKGSKLSASKLEKVKKVYAKNIKYWADRSESTLIRAEQLGLEVEKRIKKQYQKSITRIEKESAETYGKYLGEEISYSEIQKKLTREELKQFRDSVNEYYELAKRDDTKELIETIKELSTKTKITRLEALKDNIDIEIKALRANSNNELTNVLYNVGENVYKDVSKDLVENEIIDSFSKVSSAGVKKLVESSYSSKYIMNTDLINDKLSRILPKAFITGEGVKALTKEVVRELDIDYRKSQRIVRTEINRAANSVTLDRLKQNGVEKFIFIATLDNRTSDICREFNGKIFNVADGIQGVNIPALHPNCRSTVAAYFEPKDYTVIIEDEEELKRLGII